MFRLEHPAEALADAHENGFVFVEKTRLASFHLFGQNHHLWEKSRCLRQAIGLGPSGFERGGYANQWRKVCVASRLGAAAPRFHHQPE